MKDFISLKGVKRVRVCKLPTDTYVKVFYFDGDCFEYNLKKQDVADEIYVKIKNALVNRQEFVEVEL